MQSDIQILPLNQYCLIAVMGEDAERFLQGQLTCDVAKLTIGENTLCAHCDPKGKISGLFRLMRVENAHFMLLVRTELLPAALDQLKKYAVFSKVSFEQLDWQLIGILGSTSLEKLTFPTKYVFTLADGRVIACNDQVQDIDFNGTSETWDYVDIKTGVPILHAENRLEFLPQALNLQALEQTISFQKGCYIGQEMVARAKYRGANKRALYCFYADTQALPALGTEIEMQLEQSWRRTGTILSRLQWQGKLWLQVVLSNQLDQGQAFRLAETEDPLTMQPLPYALTN